MTPRFEEYVMHGRPVWFAYCPMCGLLLTGGVADNLDEPEVFTREWAAALMDLHASAHADGALVDAYHEQPRWQRSREEVSAMVWCRTCEQVLWSHQFRHDVPAWYIMELEREVVASMHGHCCARPPALSAKS